MCSFIQDLQDLQDSFYLFHFPDGNEKLYKHIQLFCEYDLRVPFSPLHKYLFVVTLQIIHHGGKLILCFSPKAMKFDRFLPENG